MNNIVHYSLFCQVLKQERDDECFVGKKDLLENDTEGEYGMKDETTELLSKLGSLITKESKSFSREGTDLRTHSGEKQFICKDCSKSFSGKHYFQVQLRTHSGDKSFTCQKCFKSFSQPIVLTRHMRIHSDCSKSFSPT